MSERLLHAYERIVLMHPRLVLLAVLLVAVALALGLPNFKLDASADSLTLENDSDLDYFREINERYGSGDFLVVTYSPLAGDDLFSDQSLATINALTEDLKQIEDVVNVLSMVNVPLLYSPKVPVSQLHETPRTLLTKGVDRELAKQEFLNSPVFRKLILGPEGQTTALLAAVKVDERYIELVRGRDALRYKRKAEGLSADESLQLTALSKEFLDYRTARGVVEKARVKAVRSLMDKYRDRAVIFLGGPSMITADMVDFIRSDLEVFGAGITLFIVLTLAVIFRQLRWVMLPLATCGFAIVMMLGWLSWIDWRLTVISSNFVALLLVLTMALTIHLIVRYRELHHENPEASQLELVRDTVNFMARPCIYTVLTTIVAFASLVVSGIRPVIDFGWMMTIGLAVSLVLGFLVIPAGMLVLGKSELKRKAEKSTQLPAHFSNFTERHGTAVLVLSLLVSIVAVVGISKLEVDNRFIDYFKEHTEIYQGLSIIDQKLGGTTPLDIIIQAPASAAIPLTLGVPEEDDPFAEEDDPFAEDVFGEPDPNQQKPSYWFSRSGLEELEQITTYLDDMAEIGRIDSLVTAFHVANDLTGHRMNDFELAVMRKGLSPQMNRFLLTPYLNDENDETRLTMRTVESGSTLNRQQLLDEITSFLIDEVGLEPEQFRLSGLMVLYNNMLQSLFHSQIVTLGAVFLGIMLMFVVLFRSLLIAFIAIFPNILAACVVLGVMGWAGIPLDMMTITIASITVGIGVDDTLHYIYRFREEFVKDRDYVATMHRSHESIGIAMYYTSIVIIVGFSILALSNFMPSVYFGFLTGLAMLTALLASQTLLPKLILLTRPLGK
ncbi:MAG: MMPL family transporter [Gammaproteobacteria bacterium]|nr:MMPL family transporter [Gammaproteobacteria bacterium]MBQ0841080.1 MMPL family transporter [Gammaproteobacteria bacterium]